jgi:two-component system, OmpR family, KDP operon response regulator KdpE
MDQLAEISVLAVEDDVAIRRLLRAAFENTRYKLLEASTAAEGRDAVLKRRPELILLDMGLPDSDGQEFIETVRGWSNTPIIIISGNDQDEVKVKALEAGADDYVTKPFSVSELLARMRVALRHASASGSSSSDSVIECGDIKIDIVGHEVIRSGERLHLTPIEFKLLVVLAKNEGKVVTQRKLLNEVWGPQYNEEAQYLRVYMGYLRKKLEPDPSSPQLLLTEPRVGYRLAC